MFDFLDRIKSTLSPFASDTAAPASKATQPAAPASPLSRLRGPGGVSDAAPNAALFGHYAEAPARARGGLAAFAQQAARAAAPATVDGAAPAERRLGMGDLRMAETRDQEREQRGADRDRLMRQTGGDSAAVAGKMIGDSYLDPQKLPPDLINPDESLGALGTKEERLKALSRLMQNDPTNPQSEDLCGPTSLIAAALYAQGNQGMETLMRQVEAGQAEDGKKHKEDPEFKALREKMKKGGELNVADMQMMQAHLYSDLRRRQEADGRVSDEQKSEGGIDGVVMQDYIKSSPEMAKMFADSKMSMSLVDTDGDKKLNHFVLGIQDDEREKVSGYTPYNMVYDPFARHGGQLVTEKDQVLDYDHARHQSL